jgi:hypothetical protein
MSEAEPAPEDMTRPELVERVRELEAAVEDLRDLTGKRTAKTNARMADIEQHLEDLQTAVESHGEQLEAVADIGAKKTGKDEKVAAIAAFAMQKTDSKQSKTTVEASEIRGCVGVTRRYAYDLIDAIGTSAECEWAAVRNEQTVTTGSGTARKKKALKVDCDRLRESSHTPRSVNKFTTRSHEEGR